jgi:hypothetical protein
MVCGLDATSVIIAVAEPPGPVAVTVAEFEAGMLAGAVNSPAGFTVPALAAQLVAPADVNCCVPPSLILTEAGEMACLAGGG